MISALLTGFSGSQIRGTLARQSAAIFIAADDDIALDFVQSANNGIGIAVHVSRDVGFKVINSIAIIDDGTVHHFTLIKAL